MNFYFLNISLSVVHLLTRGGMLNNRHSRLPIALPYYKKIGDEEMGRGERLFSFFDEFFSLLISNDNRVGVLSGDSVDELVHLFKRGGSALQCGFHRIIYIRSIHFYKIQKFLQIGSKIEAENSA